MFVDGDRLMGEYIKGTKGTGYENLDITEAEVFASAKEQHERIERLIKYLEPRTISHDPLPYWKNRQI
tara:strand:+ start:419 stop:622 length:204 start_codon:yes stop_codon:yes gene_type:complete